MTQTLEQSEIERVLQGISIPSPPQVLIDLQMEMLSPDPDLPTLGKLISRDAGLSGSILKTVNSPPFGFSQTISSINQAVLMLGMESVINLINALSIRNETKYSDMPEAMVLFMNRFWDSASDVAVASTTIANHIGFSQPDLSYLLGLFHDAGIPLLVERFDDYFNALSEAYGQTDVNIAEFENERYNTNHTVVGYYIARSWKLPRVIHEAIRLHHRAIDVFNDDTGADDATKDIVAILKLAEHLVGSYRILGRQDVDHEWNRIKEPVLNHLNLSPTDFEDIMSLIGELGLGEQSYFT